MLRNVPKPAEAVASNYYAEVDDTLCGACATCVDRCPIEAVLVNGHATVSLAQEELSPAGLAAFKLGVSDCPLVAPLGGAPGRYLEIASQGG
jgi:Fe-S-cluster-containing hydrogenase component 2